MYFTIVSIIPVILIGIYIYLMDRHKNPFIVLFKLILAGIASILLVLLLKDTIELIPFFNDYTELNYYELFIYVLVKVGLFEILIKWIMIKDIAYNDKTFKNVYDIVVYSVFLGLGYSLMENTVMYMANNNISVYLSALGTINYFTTSVDMGSYLAAAKINEVHGKKNREKLYIYRSFIYPLLSHSLYYYCIYLNNDQVTIFFLIYVIVSTALTIIKVKKYSKIHKRLLFTTEKEIMN